MYFHCKAAAIHFLLVYMCGFVGVTDGFIEVGIYSKLQAIQSLSQSRQITGWKTTGSPGLKSHNVASTAFSEVNAPIQGTYYVSTTLILQTESSESLKASILVNNDAKHKTGLTGLGSYNRSVGVTANVQLQLQDTLSVYIEFQNGSTWTVFPESTFFVQLVHSMTSYPAFHAVLSRDFSDRPASIWRRVERWDSTTNGFQVLSGFSPSIGTYCASCNGIYSIHGNVLLHPLTSTNVSVGLFFQNQTVISEASITKGAKQTANFGGIFHLNKGECIDVRTRSFQGSHSVIGGSGFSLFYLSSTSSQLHAGSYRLDAHAPLISAAGLYAMSGWTTGSSSVFFASSPALLIASSSKYQVQTEGQYFISAHVNLKSMIDNPSQSVQLLVIVDHKSSSALSDASIVTKKPISLVTSLTINGILYLSKGQTISLWLYKDGNTPVTPLAGSLFSVAMVPKDWPGVSATLNNNQLLSTPGWNELGGWQTGSLNDGLFSFDGAFLPVSGRYIVPLQGTYIVSYTININGSADLLSEAMIAVSRNLDPMTGLRAIQHSGKAGDARLSATGSIWLLPGQYLSVFVSVSSGTSWTVSRDSSFTISFNGAGKADSQGFFGVKTQPINYTTTGWKEVTGWKPRDSSLQSGVTWDSTLSRFTPDEDGLYLITANLILSYSGVTEFNAMIISDGRNNKFSAGQNFRNLKDLVATPSKVSLPLSCSLKLTKSQYVSVFVKSKEAVSWGIHGNSSISIVFVSTLTNPHRAGMNVISTQQFVVGTTYEMIILWKYSTSRAYSVYNDQIKLVEQIREGRQFVKVKVTGLYVMEVTVIVKPASHSLYMPYSLAICMKTSTQLHAIPSTKFSKVVSNFGIIIFGLLYLTRGQEVYPCIAGTTKEYEIVINAGFSLVKIVPRGINPGLRQVTDSVKSSSSSRDWSVASDWTSKGKNCLYKHGDISSYGAAKMTLLRGTYFLSSSFVLKESASPSVDICVGQDQCGQCYFQALLSNNSVTLAGSLRIQTNQDIYTCVKGRTATVARSAQILSKAGENSTFFYRHDIARFSSSGVKPLNSWTSDDGRSHTGIMAAEQGLYVASVNLVLRSSTDTSVKVITTLNTNGKSSLVPGLNVPITWIKAGSPIAVGMSSLVRILAGSSLSVKVYSDSSTSWETGANATLSAALVTKDSSFQGISVRKSRDSSLTLSSNWMAVEGWDAVNAGAVAAKSVVQRGRFVAGTSGIYLVLATLSVSVPVPSVTECTIEFLLSIDGDVVNSNTLRMSRVLRGQDGLTSITATLSLSSSVFLSKWQAVFPMIRSTPAHKVMILSDSSFYVTLVDVQRHFAQNCDNMGPHIVFHPPPLQRVAADACKTVSLNCEAVSDGKITYKWLKNDQLIAQSGPNLVINNPQLSNAGPYMCVAESNNISVTSYPAIVQVFETQPLFSRNQFEVSVNETNSGVSLLVVNFTALTFKEERANVSFVIVSGNTNGTFTLTPSISTSETTLTNTFPVDYELVKKYQLTIKATNTDTHQSTNLFVSINVQDVNDNNPEFRPKLYTASVPEGAWVNALIIQVTAIDMDSGDNSKVSYSIEGGNTGGVFDVHRNTGIVFVNKTLDYESQQSYNLTIGARDLGHPPLKSRDNAHVTISVKDSNNYNPVFESKYNFSVDENSPNGLIVGRVHATDKDHGKNGQVFYLIKDKEMSKTFSVNRTSGEISLIGSLDYELTRLYELLVTAVDQGPHPRSSAVLVSIEVKDVNDNKPEFRPKVYTASVPEGAWVNALIIQVTATDMDSGDNSKVMYSIEGSNTGGVFDVHRNTGIVFVNKTLDYESQQSYNLTIGARDLGHPPLKSRDNAHVTISVKDSNDHDPVFENKYNFSVVENSPNGLIVGQVHATDKDHGKNGQVFYLIKDKEMSKTFSVNRTSGEISLIGSLDYELTRLYELLVTAVDQGPHPRSSAVLVSIEVEDVNDNFPVFDPTAYNVEITELTTVGTEILCVHAQDKDSGIRGEIKRYAITQGNMYGNFRVTEHGGIVVNKTLDREHEQSYNLTISATDGGSPPKTSQDPCRVEIQVTDVNDNFPRFNKSRYQTTFNESASVGYDVIRVQASDDDAGPNALITYHMKTSWYSTIANQTLRINEITGIVYTTRKIDFDTMEEKSIRFRVEARDGGSPFLMSFVDVVVMVTDVNDNTPIFGNIPKTISVYDNVAERVALFTVIAKDRDSGVNGQVYYSIDKLTENGALVPDQVVFGINSSSGQVFAREAFKEDHRSDYDLLITARDLGSPSLSSCANLTIYIRADPANAKATETASTPLEIGLIAVVVILVVVLVVVLVCLYCVVNRWNKKYSLNSNHNYENHMEL